MTEPDPGVYICKDAFEIESDARSVKRKTCGLAGMLNSLSDTNYCDLEIENVN